MIHPEAQPARAILPEVGGGNRRVAPDDGFETLRP
jgi:hypothetical protein